MLLLALAVSLGLVEVGIDFLWSLHLTLDSRRRVIIHYLVWVRTALVLHMVMTMTE